MRLIEVCDREPRRSPQASARGARKARGARGRLVEPGPLITVAVTLVLWGVSAVTAATWFKQDAVFADGFESGDACTWSAVVSLDPCDGQDNDCDAEWDEDADCEDGYSCTTDSCGGALGCQNPPDFGWCLIDDVCWEHGTSDPNNPCQLCDHIFDSTGWTADSGTPCDNGVCGESGSCDCSAGFDDCDGEAHNGCETNLDTDTENCNGCDNVCDLPNAATHLCVAGECQIGECDEHYASCDSLYHTGCEEFLGHADALENTCETAWQIVGDGDFCGDEGNDIWTHSRRGSGWAKIRAEECDGYPQNDFDVAFTIELPTGATYELGEGWEGACDGPAICWPMPAPTCVECDWNDDFSGDDSKWLYVPVYHVSGSSCLDWTLRAWENTFCSK